MQLQLISQRAITIQMNNKINDNQAYELETSFNFNVAYSDDNKQCRAVLRTDVRCKDDPEMLSINVEYEGIYQCDQINNDDDRKEAHVLAYILLFPYVQYMISNIAVSAGFPSIMIERSQIDSSNVELSEFKQQ